MGGARGRAGRPTSCAPCPAASRPGSSRAAPTCRAGSASGSRSPGRWSASPTSTCSTTRSRRSTSPPTPGCAPRSARTRRDAAVVIVAQRVSTIATADDILVLEDGAVIGRGTHDELLARLPDLRRDRAVPDRREERRHDGHRRPRPTRRRRDRPRGARDPRRRPLELGGRSRRAVEGLQTALRRLGRLLGPMRVVLVVVAVIAVASAALNVLGPRVLGARHRHHHRRACSSRHGIDFGALHHVLLAGRRCSTSASAVLSIVGGLHARRRRAAADVPAARPTSRPRSTRCRSATSTSSRAATC